MESKKERARFGLIAAAIWTVACLVGSATLAEAPEGEVEKANLAFQGSVTFKTNCSNCHGPEADGQGRLVPFLDERPADLTLLRKRNDGVFPAEEILSTIDGRYLKGAKRRDMPLWGEAFQTVRDEEKNRYPDPEARVKEKLRQLVAFLETIQK